MLANFLSSIFDQEHQFQDLWELKLIKFDTDLDDEQKPYEKQLAKSTLVEDMKGNPGIKGAFILSNLRIIWHANNDRDLNLSIGLDSINYVLLKSYPQQGPNDLKHILIVKALSPSQTKYEFKFSGFRQSQERMFKKVQAIFRKFTTTKYFRNLDTNPRLTNGEYVSLDNQQFKTRYNGCTFVENQRSKEVIVILTDLRLVIIHKDQGPTNYGIPWIMIEKFIKTEYKGRDALELKIRGLLKDIEIYVCAENRQDFSKMHKQILSFSETYNRNPTLGINFADLDENNDLANEKITKSDQIVEFEQTKVNIGRKKNSYGDKNKKGTIKETFFNDELGLMMEKLPQGLTTNDLWSILKS